MSPRQEQQHVTNRRFQNQNIRIQESSEKVSEDQEEEDQPRTNTQKHSHQNSEAFTKWGEMKTNEATLVRDSLIRFLKR